VELRAFARMNWDKKLAPQVQAQAAPAKNWDVPVPAPAPAPTPAPPSSKSKRPDISGQGEDDEIDISLDIGHKRETAKEKRKRLAAEKRAAKGKLSKDEVRAKKKEEEEAAAKEARKNATDGDGGLLDDLLDMGIICTTAIDKVNKASGMKKDVTVRKVTLQYHNLHILEDTTVILNYGRRYGLIGPNGCGKTTLMKTIAMGGLPLPESIDMFHVAHEMPPSETTALESVFMVDDERIRLQTEAEELAEEVGNPDLDEEEQMQATERLNMVYERLDDMDAETAMMRAGKLLSGLGFTTGMQRKKIKEFSGGWRMRVSLARALFIQPDLLLLDEPTNHLDGKINCRGYRYMILSGL
jgi:ATP-binding cassette subfamily F protein 2